MKDYSMEEVLKAIDGSGSITATIANRLGCVWTTANTYINKWPETRRAFDDEQEKVLDLCESTLLKSINSGDAQTAKWILATKGKKRGYSERHEIGFNKDDLPVKIEIVKGE